MAASLQAAATFMQPTKLGRPGLQLKPSSQCLSKAFGVESSASRLTCSLHSDLKQFADKCGDAAKIAGFALATSALVVSVSVFAFTCDHFLDHKSLAPWLGDNFFNQCCLYSFKFIVYFIILVVTRTHFLSKIAGTKICLLISLRL